MRKVIILLLCLLLVSCGTTNKSKSTTEHTLENSFFGVKKKVKEKLIYKKDKSINSFLNKAPLLQMGGDYSLIYYV